MLVCVVLWFIRLLRFRVLFVWVTVLVGDCCWDLFVWLMLGFVFTFERWLVLCLVVGLIVLRWFSVNSVA